MHNMGRNAAERNTAGMNAVEMTHVVHRFSEKTVLDDISYQVAAGEIFGLWESRKLPVLKYSKGMRGRLLLARAVMNAPEILFLDEPTSGLDPATAAEIHRLIKEERKRGATVFLTTHNMAEAEKLCGAFQ